VFLTHLAVDGPVTASTQNQAFFGRCYLFLYNGGMVDGFAVAGQCGTRQASATFTGGINALGGAGGTDADEAVHGLMTNLLYGTGMRLMECVRLQVKDVDFDRGEISGARWQGATGRPPPCIIDLFRIFLAFQCFN